MWKPGQIVTINGVVCRVKQGKISKYGHLYTCTFCEFRHNSIFKFPCLWCIRTSAKLPRNCYLEKIK